MNLKPISYFESVKTIRQASWLSLDASLWSDRFAVNSVKAFKGLTSIDMDGIVDEKSKHDFLTGLTTMYELQPVLSKIVGRIGESNDADDSSDLHIYAGEFAIVTMYLTKESGYSYNRERPVIKGEYSINILANDDDTLNKLTDYISLFVKEAPPKQGEIFVLKRQNDGFAFGEIPSAYSALEPTNYNEHVLQQFIHIKEDLLSQNPCGRLTILSGPPGCGKSFLLKSILALSEKVKFVLIRPEMITHLADPEFVTVLLKHKETNKPYVFILEDADSCLATRMSDNMGPISAVLNTSDGILGSSLDMRIIASTNASKVDFDDAILRPGRLCQHIEVKEISADKAMEIFKRITGKSLYEASVEIEKDGALAKRNQSIGFSGAMSKSSKYTLAEVYKTVYLYNKVIDNIIHESITSKEDSDDQS